MRHLLFSLLISLGTTTLFISFLRAMEMETILSSLFPLVPFFYAISYQALEKLDKKKGRREEKIQEEETRSLMEGISALQIIGATVVGSLIRMIFEFALVYAYLLLNGLGFSEIYGAFDMAALSAFFRSDHPWLAGNETAYIIVLLMTLVLTAIATGIWIGYTTKGNAALLGVIAGSALTLLCAMTNVQYLYLRLEEMGEDIARSVGMSADIGFATVIVLQIFFYGFWSALAQKEKEERRKKKKGRKKASA